MEREVFERLLSLAKEARGSAYCPYSKISVGAALLCKNGDVFKGANIENSSFSAGICAERVAFAKAISEGERDFCAIAVAGGHDSEESKKLFSPCGVCRQFISEFADDSFKVILEDSCGHAVVFPFSELFPYGFGKENL